MGPAQSMVVNKTHKKLCVLTFNHADLLYNSYEKMYVLEPGEQKQVEALSSPIGLKIAIVYDAAPEGQYLLYQRWEVKINSILTITYVNGGDISTFGDDTVSMGKEKVRVTDSEAFARAIEALTYQSPVTRAATTRR
eukprot:gene35320-47466_t